MADQNSPGTDAEKQKTVRIAVPPLSKQMQEMDCNCPQLDDAITAMAPPNRFGLRPPGSNDDLEKNAR